MNEATEKRMQAYTMNGDRVASAGVGTEDEPYTFSRHMDVGTLLGMDHWIKILPAPGPDGKQIRIISRFQTEGGAFQ